MGGVAPIISAGGLGMHDKCVQVLDKEIPVSLGLTCAVVLIFFNFFFISLFILKLHQTIWFSL